MFTTRQAGDNDFPAILKVQKKAFAHLGQIYKRKDIAPLNQTLEELDNELHQGICFVAEDGNVIVGSVRARLDGGLAEINRLAVLPDFWNRGIGKLLMNRIEMVLRQQVREAILFTDRNDERSVRFYTGLGYIPYDEKSVGSGPEFVYMKKQLR